MAYETAKEGLQLLRYIRVQHPVLQLYLKLCS